MNKLRIALTKGRLEKNTIELFEKIDFPVDEFFPRGIENKDCCCSEKQDNDEN